MIPEELAKKIRYIQIHSSKTVNDVLAGEYHSIFKGQGMEFEEVRPYQPGDDVRAIDWNIYARVERLFIKLFEEEQDLHVFLLIESRYGHQIRRHFAELEHPNLAGPDFDAPPDDPPF